MKRISLHLLVMIATAMACVSCLGDGDDIEYTNNAGITAFSLGSLKQTFHTKTKDGLRDSSYTKSVSFSSTKFYIDQLGGKIYNPDSLPLGVDGTKVVCSLSTYNSSAIGIKNVDNDTLKYYSGSDSIDFSKPRSFYVYANSMAGRKVYEISVNIHKQDSSFVWKRMADATATVDGFASFTNMRVAAAGGRLYLAAADATGTTLYEAPSDAGRWTRLTAAGSLPASACESLVALDGKAYLLDATAHELVAAGAGGVSRTATDSRLTRLIGADAGRLYALAADGATTSVATIAADGTGMKAVAIDDDAQWLPSRDITSATLPLTTNSDVSRIIIAGNRDAALADTAAVVWTKLTDSSAATDDEQLMFYDTNRLMRMPRLQRLQMAAYAGKLVAIGGAAVQDGTQAQPARLYTSIDNGLSWQRDSIETLPDGFSSSPTAFAMTTDSDNFIWIVCGTTGQVWRGRANWLGWTREQDVFDKPRK